MEGVLVSAKLESSNKIVTVVSNAEGVYSFPRNRLEAGRYQLSIRAVGYVLPGASKLPVTVTAASGIATFTNLTLSGVIGTNYVLHFVSSPVLTAADSSNVTVSGAGAATSMVSWFPGQAR